MDNYQISDMVMGVQNMIEAAGIQLDRRGETLTLEEFAVLSNLIEANHE